MDLGTAAWWGLVIVLLLVAAGVVLQRKAAALDSKERALDALTEKQLSGMARADGGLRAVVTGANSGIGFELASRLASCGVHTILACRSATRGAEAMEAIKQEVGANAPVDLVILDVSQPASVVACARLLAERYGRIDLLYLNAGIMPVESYKLELGALAFFTCQMSHFLETGRVSRDDPHVLRQPLWAHGRDSEERSGAPLVFATHVLGHLLLVEELARRNAFGRIPVLPATDHSPPSSDTTRSDPNSETRGVHPSSHRGGGPARVIWTSSRAASAVMLSWPALDPDGQRAAGVDDEEWAAPTHPGPHAHHESYGEAKHACDLLNVSLDRRLRDGLGSSNKATARSVTICPGAVMTEMTNTPIMRLVTFLEIFRPMLEGFHIQASRGASVLLRMAAVSESVLRPEEKFVVHHGLTTTARHGVFRKSEEDVGRMEALCERWMIRWQEAAREMGEEPAKEE